MRRFDPGPRLQFFPSIPSEFNDLGEILGSVSIAVDGLKSASIGAKGGQKADAGLFAVLAPGPAPIAFGHRGRGTHLHRLRRVNTRAKLVVMISLFGASPDVVCWQGSGSGALRV